jgi:hypothetical protein
VWDLWCEQEETLYLNKGMPSNSAEQPQGQDKEHPIQLRDRGKDRDVEDTKLLVNGNSVDSSEYAKMTFLKHAYEGS